MACFFATASCPVVQNISGPAAEGRAVPGRHINLVPPPCGVPQGLRPVFMAGWGRGLKKFSVTLPADAGQFHRICFIIKELMYSYTPLPLVPRISGELANCRI